ncbi:MAG: hypothetical protein AVDCRST_MAG53-2149 [uncultured Solirubrobacteraceae bacterium]|uniref:Uncharacterized protein n=1 Tax=uncultured Solirubrobacteraceae bacterium TaxID=1162706 RepID=A0A6J4SF19_9ACTN|nr:MAG: hypothetical protein AVDCRST_MAG53-2149 [uncultured Solirubrobacteraceae bacterium]
MHRFVKFRRGIRAGSARRGAWMHGASEVGHEEPVNLGV